LNSSPYGSNMMMKPQGGIGFGPMSGVPIQQYNKQGTGSDSLRDAVLMYIRTEGDYSETGANVPFCVQKLQGQHTEHEIRTVIEDLAAEGHIYSTIDENNYKFAM
jgi:Replication protein A C terminal